MFDDPRYTQARAGSGLGALLTNYAAGVQNQQRNALAQQQLSYSNPDRMPGPKDLLGLILEDYKAKNQMNQLQSALNPSAPIQPYDPASIIQSLQGVFNMGKAPQAVGPAQAQPAAPMAPAQPTAVPASVPTSVNRAGNPLQDYVNEARKRGLIQ